MRVCFRLVGFADEAGRANQSPVWEPTEQFRTVGLAAAAAREWVAGASGRVAEVHETDGKVAQIVRVVLEDSEEEVARQSDPTGFWARVLGFARGDAE